MVPPMPFRHLFSGREKPGVDFPLRLAILFIRWYKFLGGRLDKWIWLWLMVRLRLTSLSIGHVDGRSERPRHTGQ